MNEGLEALKEYRSQRQGVNVYANEYLDIIEKELKRLEEIDNVMFLNNKKLKAFEILKAFEFEIEDYTEELNGSVSVKFKRIILDGDEIDLLKEVEL